VSVPTAAHGIDPRRIAALMRREEEAYAAGNPRSRALAERARASLVRGVPMHWMDQWPCPFPLHVASATGARITDVDGHDYADLCLGDTGAMFGHAVEPVVAAIAEQAARGSTLMLPTEDAAWVGEELRRRFGLPFWQLATSATDANRFAMRLARVATGRDKVLVFNGKYHGSVDETQVELAGGAMVPQHGVAPNAVDFARTTALVEWNDVDALERALGAGDVACVLAEPIMTNIGMVPAAPGYHDALRRLTRRHGAVLIIDETHTISTGPGGYTRAHGLEPDVFVLGKALAGGIPCAVWGLSDALADALRAYTAQDGHQINHFGFGGTLAGNALTLHAMRATLEHVMTDAAYAHMIELATRLESDVAATIRARGLPWHVTRIGARSEYLFRPTTPQTGGEAAEARDADLEAVLHLYLLNRGVLLTPFHNMSLMCPATTVADVDRHGEALAGCLAELTA
jgi:glutamate-1-semialdehyde 2,1-aminomutase